MELSPTKGIKRGAVVLGVDVGTSNIKCYAYDRFANVIGKADEKISLLNVGDGKIEIVPDVLWEKFQKVIKSCLLSSHLHASEVSCLGISTQRGTFLTWDRDTGQPFHNFISWKDKRAEDLCNSWNSSVFMKMLRFGALLVYTLTRITKFQVYSTLRFSSAMVLLRLYWILEHYSEIRQKCSHGGVLFGTIDTWLLWKLTGGSVHATDSSNACVTGFFDPFKLQWIDWILKAFNIPKNMLPEVKNTSDSFGETLPSILGSSIPVCCLVGDQQASMFGACCFEKYDINCTMGTGSFLNINTGSSPCVALHGIFPLVGWTINSKTTYVAECGMHDTGTVIAWVQNLGLFKEPDESCNIAKSINDTGGVYFLPAQNHFEVFKKGYPSSSFIGLNTNVSKEQIVRSVLEALAFQVCLLFETVCKVFGHNMKINSFRICGGVAKNDFIVQTISNITGENIHRLKHGETSSLGASFLAGLHYGIWKTQDDLIDIRREFDSFFPSSIYIPEFYKNWKNILKQGL